MIGLIIIILVVVAFSFSRLTGNVSEGGPGTMGGPQDDMMGEPSETDMACMIECTTRECDVSDMDCRISSSEACGKECNVETKAPEPADKGEECMQKCVAVGCDDFDFTCQRKNKNKCEDECDMKGDAPDESEMDEEQLCVSRCVAKDDPAMICGSSKEGETGGALCQKCANECVHLYSGPCLNDEQITEKENECASKCEHCYGGPMEGPSGEGWDCITDIKCEDASDEFGDEPGEGPGIGQEGYVAPNAVAGAVNGVIKFFKGLF